MAAPDPPIMNVDDVLSDPRHVQERPRRGVFQSRIGMIGLALHTRQIGVNVTVVPPRSKAFPRHFHFQNDELFIVLEGQGTLSYGGNDHPLRPLDVISIEAGTGIPFQIQNTSDDDLKYLALSTLVPVDVFVYPDSDKIGMMANGAPFRDLSDGRLPRLARWIRADMNADYYEGEPEA